MKLQHEYPNYQQAVSFIIDDKNPVLACNDSKQLCYFIPLKNFEKGFDYYALNRTDDGDVYFSIETLLGLKTIARTSSNYINSDLTKTEWIDVIYDTTMIHFNKEEYVALKHGYVKKDSRGCATSILLILVLSLFISLMLY